MESEIQVTGLLGTAKEQTIFSSQEKPDTKIVNVQVSTSYPKTGEQFNPYLFFSGICILLLLLILKKRKTAI